MSILLLLPLPSQQPSSLISTDGATSDNSTTVYTYLPPTEHLPIYSRYR